MKESLQYLLKYFTCSDEIYVRAKNTHASELKPPEFFTYKTFAERRAASKLAAFHYVSSS